MKKLLIVLIMLLSMPAFAILEVQRYLQDIDKATALLSRIASRTMTSVCDVNIPNMDRKDAAMQCQIGKSSFTETAKLCAEERAKQLCRAKGFKECDSAMISTTFRYYHHSGDICRAMTALTVE